MSVNKKDNVVVNVKDSDKTVAPKKARNIMPKILSLLLAFVLWFYVVSVESPINEQTFNSVEIKLTDPAEGLSVIAGKGNTVDITVRGKKSDLDRLTNEDFDVTVDISALDTAGVYELPVKVIAPSGTTLVNQPNNHSVKLDQEVHTSVTVNVVPVNVQLEAGYRLGSGDEIKTRPSQITLKGPETELSKIEEARVEIDCGGLVKENIEMLNARIKLIDSNGEVVNDPYISQSDDYADVTIPLYLTKTLPVEAVFAESYVSDGESFDISYDIKEIEVKGKASDLQSMDKLKTVEIAKLENKEEQTVSVSVDFPEGIAPTNGDTEVLVNVTVKRKDWMQRTFYVQNFEYNNVSDSDASISFEDVPVTLAGPKSVIGGMSADDISLSIDLSQLSAKSGSYTLEADVSFSENVPEDQVVLIEKGAVSVTVS